MFFSEIADSEENLLAVDTYNFKIWKIRPNGEIFTIAGTNMEIRMVL